MIFSQVIGATFSKWEGEWQDLSSSLGVMKIILALASFCYIALSKNIFKGSDISINKTSLLGKSLENSHSQEEDDPREN